MTYTIRNTAGNTVATIAPNTTSGSAFPIIIPGMGISPYGEIIGEDLYHLMENFANSVPPTNPVPGMLWYSTVGELYFYDGTNWILIGGIGSTTTNQLPPSSASANVDFTTTSTTVLVTNNTTMNFYPTMLVIEPDSAITATGNALFNLNVVNSEDVLENSIIELQDDFFGSFVIQGKTRMVKPGENLNISIVNPMSGGSAIARVSVFGMVR